MNRRTFLKACAAISGGAFVPVGAAVPVDAVRWVTSLYDYDRSLGICGAVGGGEQTIRAAVMFDYWSDLSEAQKETCLGVAKHYIRHALAKKQHITYGRQVIEGNEVAANPYEVLDCLRIDASTS